MAKVTVSWPATSSLVVTREVEMDPAGGRFVLSLVLAAKGTCSVRMVGGCRHLQETELPDLHRREEQDRQGSCVAQFERQVTTESGVDVASSGMDNESKASEGTLALESADDVIWERDLFQRISEAKLAWLQDEWFIGTKGDQFGQVCLIDAWIDMAVTGASKDAEAEVQSEVHAGRLHRMSIEWLDANPSVANQLFDCPVTENHRVISRWVDGIAVGSAHDASHIAGCAVARERID